MEKYNIGFDIGSDSVHAVVLDSNEKIVYSPESIMHFGNPIDALKDIYEEIIEKFGYENISTTAFTGSVGEFIAKETKTPFFHDTISIPIGVGIVAPDTNYICHIGAKNPYFFEREKIKTKEGVNNFVPDHGTGTKCGGGSGILITKQCRRFFEDEFSIKLGDDRKQNRTLLQEHHNNMFKRAEEEISKSDKDIDVGGRCGVVIQSDMIHLQNRGEQITNILKGMFERIVKNYKSDVIKTRIIENDKKAIATGGIWGNKLIVKILEKELGINVTVPENYQQVGAIGAAIKAKGIEQKFKPEELNFIAESEKGKIKTAPALSTALDKVKIYDEEKAIEKKEDLTIYNIDKNKKTDVLLGIDGGSTTTKAIVADANNLKIIAEICLYTNGKPLQTAQDMLRQIRDHIGKDIEIKGVSYTGSSGAFYYKLFTDLKKNPEKECVDIIKDEITCHAFGVKHFNNNVDTIFELGGQDAKFTLFNKDGTVNKSKMNLSCMAGTGQTMHNMVEMVGLDIKTTFHEYALKAKKTPIVDETCGVFTEAGIAKLIAMGFSKEEVAAAIVYGFMGGYVNKFVGTERFGDYASAQGGPFNGKSCLAALALHTGIEVHAFPHRQLFGALGGAIAVHNEIKRLKGKDHESKFRGLDVSDMNFEKEVKNCSNVIKDSCGVRDCQLQIYKIGEDMIYSGGICPKGNTDTATKIAPNYVDMYKRLLNKELEKYSIDLSNKSDKERILIPRSLTFLNERGVFYTALYNSLGFDVCISPESDDEIANLGINYSHSETCFPIKLAHGHGAYLKKHLRKGKDKILFINTVGAKEEKLKFCPYVGAAGLIVKDAVDIANEDTLLPVVCFDDPDYEMNESILNDLKRLFGERFSLEDVNSAIEKAETAEKEFLDRIYSTGKTIVKGLKDRNEKIFMGIGRGYTILDDKSSSKVHELFASYGLHFIPSFFLKCTDYDIKDIADNMYWYQGQNIIRYNLMAAIDKAFYVVRETNFNCGTDSILLYHEEDIINKSEKPHLVLQTDGHNSNAQFGTRTLANNEVVKKHNPKPMKFDDFKKTIPAQDMKSRIIGVPYMGDSANAIVSSIRVIGLRAEIMPTYTKRSQELARKFVSSNTCRPFSFQIGDNLAWLYELKEKGIDPNKEAAVIQPQTKGPCRYGQYCVMIRHFLDENGFTEVPVISPDSSKDYTNLPLSKMDLAKLSMAFYKGSFCNDVLYDALLRTRPYEKEKGNSEKKYNSLRDELYKLIEAKVSLKELASFMKKAKEKFEALIDPGKKRKPIVVMNGEIFVRCHPKANQDSIKLLEKYGLEVILNPTTQWLEYVNEDAIMRFKDSKEWTKLVVSLVKRRFISKTHSALFEPFEEYLKGREPHDIKHVLDTVQKDLVYEKKIGGEAPLSIGEAYLFAKGEMHDICGIYHVGPFGCMQETTATSKIQAIIQKRRNEAKTINEKIIPFMDSVFGESELPNLEAEIAAFAEKCYLKKELNSNQQHA